jgi:DNA mismatch endonuclease (patch repair protein)
MRPPASSPEAAARMRRQGRKDTRPELIVRQVLRALGRGYRLNRKELPGSPDLSSGAGRWAVFVHGCYWHQHPGCRRATVPTANHAWWVDKFRRNTERDSRKVTELEAAGFTVLIVWECETRDPARLHERLACELPPRAGIQRLGARASGGNSDESGDSRSRLGNPSGDFPA